MFDEPFVFFFAPIAIAIVALVFARKAINQVAELRERLDLIEKLAAAATTAMPPPLPPLQEFEQSLTVGFIRGRTGAAANHSGYGIHCACRNP